MAIAGALAGIVFPSLLLLPQFTVENLGFTSTLAGIMIGIRALPVLLLTMPVARLTSIPQLDLRWLIGGGLAVAGLGLLWLAGSVTTQSDLGTFVLPLLVIGTGSACVYSPLLVAMMRAVTPDAAAKAASFIVLCVPAGRLDLVGVDRRVSRSAAAVPSNDSRRQADDFAAARHQFLQHGSIAAA